MTFWGELTDGTELLLGEPMEAQLLYDSDAPASQLRAVFPAEKLWEDLAVVRVFHQGQVAFGGIVDEQNTALSGEGFTVELIARSWEALLLDNEARPAVLRSPSLGLLWERYFQPLGLTSVVGDQSPKAGELAVEKGTSCWELLDNFCRDYLGTAPWVDGKGTLHCEGPQETKVIAGRVLSAELSRLPCKQLSAVWQQSFRGTYDTPFRGAAGVKRQRYVSMEDGRDPRELLRQGERESWLLSVECQGNSWPGPGALVTVEAPRLGRFEDCPCARPGTSGTAGASGRGLCWKGGRLYVADKTGRYYQRGQAAPGAGFRRGPGDDHPGGERVPLPGAAVPLWLLQRRRGRGQGRDAGRRLRGDCRGPRRPALPGRGAALLCGRRGNSAEKHRGSGHQRPELPGEIIVKGARQWI